MSDDLVERVARAMAVADGWLDPDVIINNDTPDCPQPLWMLYRYSAPAAIALVLEEAAKVADATGSYDAIHIAAAIRALAKEPQG